MSTMLLLANIDDVVDLLSRLPLDSVTSTFLHKTTQR